MQLRGGFITKFEDKVELICWSEEDKSDAMRVFIEPRVAASLGFEMVLQAASLDPVLEPSRKYYSRRARPCQPIN